MTDPLIFSASGVDEWMDIGSLSNSASRESLLTFLNQYQQVLPRNKKAQPTSVFDPIPAVLCPSALILSRRAKSRNARYAGSELELPMGA